MSDELLYQSMRLDALYLAMQSLIACLEGSKLESELRDCLHDAIECLQEYKAIAHIEEVRHAKNSAN